MPKERSGPASAALGLAVLLVAAAAALVAWRYAPAPLFAGAGPAALQEVRDTLGDIPADQWLQAPAGGIRAADLRGSVVLVEFWTYLCYNCKNVEPWVKTAAQRYASQGLRVIGVHTPEFNVERRAMNVARYLRENGITYPVAIDNGFRVWRRYNTTNAWPAFLVFDRYGRLAFREAGEGAVVGAEAAIRTALAEGAAPAGAWRDAGDGVRFAVRVTAPPGARSAVMEVTLAARPGFKLVRSPANEVWLDAPDGVASAANPVLVGDRFAGTQACDVRYFDGPATVRFPVALPVGAAPPALRGRIVYRVCDTRTNVCLRRERAFREPVRGG